MVSLKPNDRPFLKRRLNASWSEWIRPPSAAPLLLDRAVAAERPHLVLQHAVAPSVAAGASVRVLVLRQKRRPEVDRVEVHVLQRL